MAATQKGQGRRYSKRAGKKVGRAIQEMKRGKLRTGAGKKVTSRRQAVAIGLSEARGEGARVPKARSTRKSSSSGRGRKRSSGR